MESYIYMDHARKTCVTVYVRKLEARHGQDSGHKISH